MNPHLRPSQHVKTDFLYFHSRTIVIPHTSPSPPRLFLFLPSLLSSSHVADSFLISFLNFVLNICHLFLSLAHPPNLHFIHAFLSFPLCVLDASGLKKKAVNVYTVADHMAKKGWSLNPLQNPACVHICCTLRHVGREQVRQRMGLID